jgi:hypothetical protein
MKVMSQSLWRRAAAQAAIFALMFQAAFGLLGCEAASGHPARVVSGVILSKSSPASSSSPVANASKSFGASVLSALCTANGFKPPASNTGDSPVGAPHDCPVCVSHGCHSGAIAAAQASPLAAPLVGSTPLAPEARRLPLAADPRAFRNRGPPFLSLV